MKNKLKKLTSILLFAILAVSLAFSFACGSSTFNGNYKKISAQEIANYSAQIENSKDGGKINFTDGYEVVIKTNITGISINSNYKFTTKNGTINLALLTTLKTQSSTIKTNIYYDGEYAYCDFAVGGQTVKIKQKINYEELLDEFADIPDVDFIKIYSELTEYAKDVFVAMAEETEEQIKIKLELPKNSRLSGTYFSKYQASFVFDKNYNVQAIRCISNSVIEGIKQNLTITIETFNGNISMPNSADYILGEIPEI